MHSLLLTTEPSLQILPTLACKLGLNEAIILQQVHYWLDPEVNKNLFEERYWVQLTYEQWKEQFPFWSNMTIRRVINNLEKLGIIDSFITQDFHKLKYYTINYGALATFTETNINSYQKL